MEGGRSILGYPARLLAGRGRVLACSLLAATAAAGSSRVWADDSIILRTLAQRFDSPANVFTEDENAVSFNQTVAPGRVYVRPVEAATASGTGDGGAANHADLRPGAPRDRRGAPVNWTGHGSAGRHAAANHHAEPRSAGAFAERGRTSGGHSAVDHPSSGRLRALQLAPGRHPLARRAAGRRLRPWFPATNRPRRRRSTVRRRPRPPARWARWRSWGTRRPATRSSSCGSSRPSCSSPANASSTGA